MQYCCQTVSPVGPWLAHQQGSHHGLPLEGVCRRECWWGGHFQVPLLQARQPPERKGGCSCLEEGGHRGSARGWLACCTAGLIPDALPGVQGAVFVCLPAPRSRAQNLGPFSPGFCSAPCFLSTPAGTYSVPTEACGDAQLGWLARNAEAPSLAHPPPSTRQIASPCRQGN